MDERLASLLEYIAAALESGKVLVQVNIGSSDHEQETEIVQGSSMLPMLWNHVKEYIQEEHRQLASELLSPIAMASNGDILIRTNSKGLQYYKDNKKELYDSIYLKSGATNVYIYAADTDECWVQYESDQLIQDIGQMPEFGTKSMDEQQQETEQDYEMSDRPLLTIEEMVGAIKEQAPQLTGIKLYAADMVEIIKIIQHRLTMQACDAIENTINERDD